jgi:hypothetical protein
MALISRWTSSQVRGQSSFCCRTRLMQETVYSLICIKVFSVIPTATLHYTWCRSKLNEVKLFCHLCAACYSSQSFCDFIVNTEPRKSRWDRGLLHFSQGTGRSYRNHIRITYFEIRLKDNINAGYRGHIAAGLRVTRLLQLILLHTLVVLWRTTTSQDRTQVLSNYMHTVLAECPQCYCEEIRQILIFLINLYFPKAYHRPDHSIRIV